MKGKVCIIDHDLASRGYLRECIEREGHDVVIFNSGLQIKPFLEKEPIDLFILNIDTPGVREKNLLIDLKKNHLSKILLIVSERGDPFLKAAIDLWVYGFIYKPFNIEEVCTMVNHLTH